MATQIKERCIIGIDESYTRTGIAVIVDGEVTRVFCERFKGCRSNTEKRVRIKRRIQDTVAWVHAEYNISYKDIKVIIERIRTFSGGHLSTKYLITTGALVATIIDAFASFNLSVYSVDTKSWKNNIVGSSKPYENKYGINPNKYRTVLYIRDKGYLHFVAEPYTGRGKKGIIPIIIDGEKIPCKINDDMCDAICIALYGTLPKQKQKLIEEKI